jgi:hypothetical protein
MNIYIDESGSFVSAKHEGAWNAVAALAAPETARKGIESAVGRVLASRTDLLRRELKLKDIDEQSYFTFLHQLGRLPVALFCVATDAGLNSQEIVIQHQKEQAAKLRFNIPKMRFEAGRQGLEKLANDVATLSPQLYVQLICQVELIHDALIGSVTYFVQRHPRCLREIRWRIDQKNADKPTFEKTFERITPAVLQTKSLERPFPMVREFDYSAMRQYEFAEGAFPTYLRDDYGIDTRGEGWNIGKMIRGNIEFVDSTVSTGVQAADLVVSGIRRCLRREFHDNNVAADLLGCLMVQAMEKRPPIALITLGTEANMHPDSGELVKRMAKRAKPMLL